MSVSVLSCQVDTLNSFSGFSTLTTQSQPACGKPGYDRLYKVRPLLNIVLENFMDNYIPIKNISIDESIIGCKGRLSFIQYMPNKPHKWGLKAWVLADSMNSYTWGWKLYTGKEEGAIHDLGLSHRIVLELMIGYCTRATGFLWTTFTPVQPFSQTSKTMVLRRAVQYERIVGDYLNHSVLHICRRGRSLVRMTVFWR